MFPAPVMLAPDTVRLPLPVLMPAPTVTPAVWPPAELPPLSFADKRTLPPFVVIAAFTLICSPACAVSPMPALLMLMALLKSMRCKACKVTLLVAAEIRPAAISVVLSAAVGASENWSTCVNVAPAEGVATMAILYGSSSQSPILPLAARARVSTLAPSTAR